MLKVHTMLLFVDVHLLSHVSKNTPQSIDWNTVIDVMNTGFQLLKFVLSFNFDV